MPFLVQKSFRVNNEIVTVWLRQISPSAIWGPRSEGWRYASRADARMAVVAVTRADEVAALSIVEE